MRKDTGQANEKKILKYITGELIIKQGDYGISIYKIVSGKVKIFRTYKGREVPLGIMEPGELFGEAAFLSKEMSVRSASAVALEDTELEIWHPRDLAEKYAQASPVLKIIMNQALFTSIPPALLQNALSFALAFVYLADFWELEFPADFCHGSGENRRKHANNDKMPKKEQREDMWRCPN